MVHNDGIAVPNRHILFCNEQAFAHQEKLLDTLRERV
ncbi:N-succinylarginine dihydrolase, partial [Pseudomonas aeruginosa]|nr:N-succinylarginine dihydrolase [Pseudomonas aeruginosa]